MFKLVVLSALLAAAVADPGVYFAPSVPLAYTSTVVSPSTTTITKQASSVVHPSPLVYASPLAYSAYPAYAHLIKKRSAPLAVSTYYAPTSYIAPFTTYSAPIRTIAAAPITAYTTPFYRTAPVLATAHLIKKRSAPLLLPSTYIAPTYARVPFVSTYAAATPIISTPIVSHAPIAYASHFIKKRSVAIPIIAPAAYSHTSRVDYRSSPAVTTYTTYSRPILTHIY